MDITECGVSVWMYTPCSVSTFTYANMETLLAHWPFKGQQAYSIINTGFNL